MSRSERIALRDFEIMDDVSRLVALYAAVDAVDGTRHAVDAAKANAHLGLWGHDPTTDRWVLVDPDLPSSMAGHAAAYRDPQDGSAWIQIAVAPPYRRQGQGTRLLDLALDRAGKWGSKSALAYARGPGGAAFLIAHGFRLDHRWSRLERGRSRGERIAQGGSRRSGSGTPSFRPWDGEPALLARLFTEAYDGLAGHAPVTPEQVIEWSQDWKAGDTVIAFHEEGQAIGVARTERRPAEGTERAIRGWIDAPGLTREYRRPEAYLALLDEAIRHLEAAGCDLFELESWGDDPAVLSLYASRGFREVDSIDHFVLRLE